MLGREPSRWVTWWMVRRVSCSVAQSTTVSTARHPRRPICEHPATSTDAAIRPAIRIMAKASGPTRDRWPGAAARLFRYRRVMHEHIVRATIESGTVEGFTRDGVNRWRSIPYARPPMGRLRLRAPQPPLSRGRACGTATGSATARRSSACTRSSRPGKYQPMSEDCLTLNVVAPKHRRRRRCR